MGAEDAAQELDGTTAEDEGFENPDDGLASLRVTMQLVIDILTGDLVTISRGTLITNLKLFAHIDATSPIYTIPLFKVFKSTPRGEVNGRFTYDVEGRSKGPYILNDPRRTHAMTLADAWNVPRGIRDKDGKEYPLRKPTQVEQGQFAVWLEGRAHAAVDRSEDSEERKLKRHHLIDVDAGLGKYEWDGPLALEAMWTPAGFAKILTIVCRDQGVDDTKAEEILATTAQGGAASSS